jgi:hypothetical protein
MNEPEYPSPPPVILGTDAFGRPVYGHPLTSQPPAYGPVVPLPPQRTAGPPVGRWIALAVTGAAVSLALAVSIIAVAISAVALTVCLLILRSVWNDIRKGRT